MSDLASLFLSLGSPGRPWGERDGGGDPQGLQQSGQTQNASPGRKQSPQLFELPLGLQLVLQLSSKTCNTLVPSWSWGLQQPLLPSHHQIVRRSPAQIPQTAEKICAHGATSSIRGHSPVLSW